NAARYDMVVGCVLERDERLARVRHALSIIDPGAHGSAINSTSAWKVDGCPRRARGNGSGKSTLAKLISLHYQPRGGSITFGRTEVSHETLRACRACISAIFTDSYLFDRLLSAVGSQEQALVDALLADFGLSKHVRIEAG